ncbi:MAG: ferrochelatase [Acidimicrobiales bacterium]|nr:ferrochelatase [Acidimicrobiales bacterium]
MASLHYDAVLLLSFGGPEGPDDVLPFLENVTRGRGVPRERLEEVAEQYELFGGVSPINAQNRALLGALRAELDRRGRDVPLYWGNRNWVPYVEDVLEEITADGHGKVLALATAAYSSYSACRQYLEDIERARAHVGDDAPAVDKVRPFWNHPGFVEAVAERLSDALGLVDAGARLVFTAHSIPESMAATSDYEVQLRDVATQVVERVAPERAWDLVFQSRSGPPQVPWLEPDIVDHLEALAAAGTEHVAVVPIGFVSDHMEVAYDLDTQAAEAADRLGLTMTRVATVGTHPTFVSGLVDLLDEYLLEQAPVAVGSLGPRPWPCRPGCCPAPVRPTRPS